MAMRAIEHGNIRIGLSGFAPPANFRRQKFRLLLLVSKLPNLHFAALVLLCCELLVSLIEIFIHGDRGVRNPQDGFRRAVVLVQPNALAAVEVLFFKLFQAAVGGSAKTIDGLVIITHDRDVAPFARQQL